MNLRYLATSEDPTVLSLVKEVKRLRKALRVYADKDYWDTSEGGPMGLDQSLVMNAKSEGWFRPGKAARDALKRQR